MKKLNLIIILSAISVLSSASAFSEKLLTGDMVEHKYIEKVEVTMNTVQAGEGVYLLDDGTCEKRKTVLVSIEKTKTVGGYHVDLPVVKTESRTIECPA
jgi:hypothetical protein